MPVQAELPVYPFSVNEPDKNQTTQEFAAEPKLGRRRYLLFAPGGKLSPRQNALAESKGFVDLLDSIDLRSGESLHITSGDISVYLRERSLTSADSIFAGIAGFAKEIELDESSSGPVQLPEQFRALASLIKKWAVSDDADREEIIGDAPKSELQDLVSRIEPLFDSIETYLDSFKQRPLNQAAIALGHLAEAAHEARLRLQEKYPSGPDGTTPTN
jgi:hypothetical protein